MSGQPDSVEVLVSLTDGIRFELLQAITAREKGEDATQQLAAMHALADARHHQVLVARGQA